MVPERWEKIRWEEIKEKLHAALELEPQLRPAYLDQVAGTNSELRSEIESLIASHEAAESEFLNAPAASFLSASAASDKARVLPGKRLGSYQIVELIGSGGMGEVYRAARVDDQYQKQVAIKLVRAGHDSGFVVSRFRNERQILAALDHPNIARLLDAGCTEEGAPYFVMELIVGEPIDQYCNRNQLSLNNRLQLFLRVCSAMQYAHQRLIVHRDLKPVNIFVTAEGEPKLLDFGIAKILDADSVTGGADPTLTVFRALTPGYASPEQVRGEAITTASDVYSLGVVLYELLTGQHPYREAGATPQQVANAVCEVEPRKPSTVANRAATTDNIAGKPVGKEKTSSGANVEKLSKHLRGDLDNIILMALRKEPQRRYVSVEQFAEDIRRHLDNRPVIARKDTFGYRTSKFVRRNRAGVAAAAIVLVTLLTGLFITIREARIAQAQRARAERRFNDVRKLANSLLFDIHDSIRNLPGSIPARKVLVERAREYLDSLAQESGGDSGLQRELAAAYQKVGDVQGNPRMANLGDITGAIDSYRKAVQIRLSLADETHGSPDDQAALFDAYMELGMALQESGDYSGALDTYHKANSIAEKLAAQRKTPESQEELASVSYGIARCLYGSNDLPGSLEYYKKSAAIREGITGESPVLHREIQSRLAGVYGYMSGVVHQMGDLEGAISLQSKSHDILAQMVATDPQNASLKEFLLQTDYWIGYYMAEKGRPEQALADYRQALAGYQELTSADPKDALAKQYLGQCYVSIGAVLRTEGKTKDGIQNIRDGVKIFEELTAADSGRAVFRLIQVASTYSDLGDVYMQSAERANSGSVKIADLNEAHSWYQKGLETWGKVKEKNSPGKFDAVEFERLHKQIAKCDDVLRQMNAQAKAQNK
jgi:serine/threonine protein kinase